MNKNISFNAYKTFDITIFTLLTIFFEWFSMKGLSIFNGMYYISLFLVLSLIVMLRWKWYAIIPMIAAGFTRAIVAMGGFDVNYILMYVGGNLFSLLSIIWIFKFKENITKNHYLLLFVLTGFFGYCLGQTVFGTIIFNRNFIDLLISIASVESLNAIISFIVIFIASRQKGLLEDQKEFIKKTQQEEMNTREVENEN